MTIKEQIIRELDARREQLVLELYNPHEEAEYQRLEGMHYAYVDMLIYLESIKEK